MPQNYIFPPSTFPPLVLRIRRGSTAFTVSASLKERIGRIKKTWSDLSSLNYWVVRLVNSVNAFEPHIENLSDEQNYSLTIQFCWDFSDNLKVLLLWLSEKTMEFRRRLREGETLASIQAEAFAVVREAAKRKLGMRHFDVQIIGGALLHDGCIAEMKTGEGKTVVSTLGAYLNALSGEGVHDASWGWLFVVFVGRGVLKHVLL